MPVRLIVKWDGDISGLGEERLSLNAFGKALTYLRASLRRIATNLVHEALREQEARTGRLTNAAREIDVQLTHLLTNSAGIDSLVTILPPPGQAFSLFEELPASATLKFLDAIEAERQGILTNASVRRYLESLPGGLSKQTYSVYRDGTRLREISFGEVRLAQTPLDLPYLAEYVGAIVGVGFEPGQPEVRIQTDTSLVTLTATSRQVETALTLRSLLVRGIAVVHGASRRLLSLQEANRPITRETRELAIFERWKGALARLAQ
jgi:hypothetical protein